VETSTLEEIMRNLSYITGAVAAMALGIHIQYQMLQAHQLNGTDDVEADCERLGTPGPTCEDMLG
jgi:hypothetical protein